jgi:hypothetical protein
MWFDERLKRKRRVKHIEMKGRKLLNLMRAVAGYDWGWIEKHSCICTRH